MAADHLGKALTDLEASVKQTVSASLLDHKTPLQNERGLARMGEILLKMGTEAWLFSGDINDFKNLNTQLLYDGADLVLNEVGTVLDSLFSLHCFGFRRGGDEFVLVVLAEHLDEVIQALSTRLCPLKVPVEGNVYDVTTSFGYVKVDHRRPFRENLERADQACKAAKWNHGGGPVAWFEGIKTGYSDRLRCPGCRSQFSISVSPEESKKLPSSLKCMVCGDDLPMKKE